MKLRLPLLLILATIAPAIAAAQTTGTLTGTVTDAEGKPVAGATIKVKGTSPLRGAVSQQDGSYRVAGIRDGVYTVEVTAVGYLTVVREGVLGYLAVVREGVRIEAGATTTLALQFTVARSLVDMVPYHHCPTPTLISTKTQIITVRCLPPPPSLWTPMKVQSITREDLLRSSRTSIFGEP